MLARRLARLAWIVPLLTVAVLADEPPEAQGEQAAGPTAAAKRPLDHESYDRWNRIQGQTISNDGKWVLYTLRPGKPRADVTLKIRRAGGDDAYQVLRGTSARFTADSRRAIYLVQPDREEVKKAREEGKKQKKKGTDHLPKAALELLDLATGETVTIARVKSFSLPEESGDWLVYLHEKPLEPVKTGAEKEGVTSEAEPAPEAAKAEPPVEPQKPEPKPEPAPPAEPVPAAPKPAQPAEPSEAGAEQEGEAKKPAKKKDPGTELVLRDLRTGAEYRFPDVVEYEIAEDGSLVAFATSAEAADGDGVFVIEGPPAEPRALMIGRGHYKSLAVDEGGRHLAFLTDRDDYEAKQPAWAVAHWTVGAAEALVVAREGTAGLPEGWWIADSRGPSFSKQGRRLLFGTRPKPEPEEEKTENGEEGDDAEEDELPPVKLDVWNWKDPLLQPMQLLQAQRERNRSYDALVHLDDGTVVQLEDEQLERVTIADRGDGAVAAGFTGLPYRRLVSWDYPGYQDVYVVDVRTGSRELALERVQGSASLSPHGKYVTWFDFDTGHWHAMSVKTRQTVSLTELVPHAVQDELHDEPSPAGSYGSAGWVGDDVAFIVYDRYDLWLTNPSGFFPPSCITDGWGREHGTRLRRVRLDRDEISIDSDAPLLLSALDDRTKASGFCRDRVRATAPPEVLVMKGERLSNPEKAEDAEALLLTRETFDTFPDLWVADADFRHMTRISDANPQQAEYSWGTAELVGWTSADGEPLQGILCKPEGFDPSRQYPMMVYFYERNSQNLHRYTAPAGSRSVINFSFYVSRGYLLFIPDIPYEVGAPGASAMNAVMPGVASLIDRGFVDRHRIGVQGHSWGGYQIAYMVTRTDLFRCAESGAPVSNMTSAYGGIRWSSGMSRMFQYEKTQSRIGGTLWDAQQYYIENSPVFWADRIETPLLILHNDEDGAVPWYQGIELFVALRRLGKPAWMLNYNGEAHGLGREQNQRDFAVRMQQFFDHYLRDAPAPVWLAEGVPAAEKGKTLGLEPVEEKP